MTNRNRITMLAIVLALGSPGAACGPKPGNGEGRTTPPAGPTGDDPSHIPATADSGPGLGGPEDGSGPGPTIPPPAPPDPPGTSPATAAPPSGSRVVPTQRSTVRRKVAYRPVWKKGLFKGIKSIEDEIVRQVNRLRRSKRLGTLSPDERLRTAARQHTLEMMRKRYYTHSSPVSAWRTPARRACLAGFLDPFVAENIGQVVGVTDAATELMQAWKGSSIHLANMINRRYTRIGVGVATMTKRGYRYYYSTQLFAFAPLGLRRLAIVHKRRKMFRVTADLFVDGSVKVKAFKDRTYLGDVPRAGRAARLVHNLGFPVTRTANLHFGLLTSGNTPLICATVTVRAGGRITQQRNTYHALCRRISRLNVSGGAVAAAVRVLEGEARANAFSAVKTRTFLDRKWGPAMNLKLGRWMRFALDLPGTNPVKFNLVVGGLLKEYLILDERKKNPFICR